MTTLSPLERSLLRQGFTRIAGIDEAGRGPLAGPVVAAAVVFPGDVSIEGIADSKKLTAKRRGELVHRIVDAALGVGIGMATHEEIDALNILQASLLAMRRAVEALSVPPDYLLIDGNRRWPSDIPSSAIVRGDATVFSIAAASIIAKETRDDIMVVLDHIHPEYGFASHKGYPTAQHRAAVVKYGPSPVHRRTFTVTPPSEQLRIDL